MSSGNHRQIIVSSTCPSEVRGAEKNQSAPGYRDREKKMWDRGACEMHTPRSGSVLAWPRGSRLWFLWDFETLFMRLAGYYRVTWLPIGEFALNVREELQADGFGSSSFGIRAKRKMQRLKVCCDCVGVCRGWKCVGVYMMTTLFIFYLFLLLCSSLSYQPPTFTIISSTHPQRASS